MLGKYAFLNPDNSSLPSFVPLNGSHLLMQEKKMLSFCSQDYLGLSDSVELKKNAMRFLLEQGIGSASTYFEGGFLSCETKLQEKLARLLGKEASLFFHSRHQANILTLSSIAKNATIFIDRSSHPSLKEGVIRSGSRIKSYRHNDMSHLEALLESSKETQNWIVTESLFSQEGDFFALKELLTLAKKYQALLFVDDSHAIGLAGYDGLGLAAHQKDIDFVTGSFSKACGAFGAYGACSQKMKEHLLQSFSDTDLFSLPPAVLGTIDAALDLLPHMDGERKQLMQRSHWIRKELHNIGFSLPTCITPIISLPCANKEEAEFLLKLLADAGILAKWHYCSEEETSYHFILTITAHHSPEHLSQLAEALKSQALVFRR